MSKNLVYSSRLLLNNSLIRQKTALLSVEFVLHAPRRSLATTSDPNDLAPRSYTLVVHNNSMDLSLLDILNGRLAALEGKEGSTVPEWVRELLPPSSSTSKEDVPDILFLLLKQPPTPPKKLYHALGRSRPLDKVLQKKRFIEWPTIHVWLTDEFEEGHIIGRDVPNVQEDEPPPYPYKKRKLNVQAGKKVLSGLVGGYASGSDDQENDDEDAEEDAEGEADGMIGLMEYESGGEEAPWAHVPKGEFTRSM